MSIEGPPPPSVLQHHESVPRRDQCLGTWRDQGHQGDVGQPLNGKNALEFKHTEHHDHGGHATNRKTERPPTRGLRASFSPRGRRNKRWENTEAMSATNSRENTLRPAYTFASLSTVMK